MRIEVLPLIVNVTCLAYYLCNGWGVRSHIPFEPGKVLYWFGATFLTIGLLRMKG